MKRHTWTGAVAALGVALSPGAFADEAGARCPPGEQGASSASNELVGAVVGAEGKTLYLKGEVGQVIPVEIAPNTRLFGQQVQGGIEQGLKSQLIPGQEVRASFELKGEPGGEVKNVARTIDRADAIPVPTVVPDDAPIPEVEPIP